jgi:hypothetical protein
MEKEQITAYFKQRNSTNSGFVGCLQKDIQYRCLVINTKWYQKQMLHCSRNQNNLQRELGNCVVQFLNVYADVWSADGDSKQRVDMPINGYNILNK